MSNDILYQILKWWDFVEIFRNYEFKNNCWIFRYISGFIFSIQPVLLKGIPIYYLNICELFWDVKIENRVLEKYKKKIDKKQERILKRNCKNIYIKDSPVHNSKITLCNGTFSFKNNSRICSDICDPVLWCPKMRARIEKLDMLSWNQS